MVIFIVLAQNEEPSSAPIGDDSQADTKVARGLRIESNWMWVSPFRRGVAVNEWNNTSVAKPIPVTSDMGMGLRGGMDGVFLNRAQF